MIIIIFLILDYFRQTGPVRLFTPYKRRRRTRETSEGGGGSGCDGPPRKLGKSENSRDDGSNNEESDSEVGITDKKVWSQYVSADGIVVHQAPTDQDQHHQTTTVIHQSVHQTDNINAAHDTEQDHISVDDMFKKLDDVSNKILKLAYEFRKTLEETKEATRQQRREQALVAQLATRGEVIGTVGLQPASGSHNKKVLSLYFPLLLSTI